MSASDESRSTGPAIVVAGVSGSGKSTIGAALAGRLAVVFVDGDDLHSADNVAKMAAGLPLSDADRAPWLEAVGARLAEGGVVIACSALRRAYRDRILAMAPSTRILLLTVPRDELERRMLKRADHFMPASLLDSQLAALEPPAEGEPIVVLDGLMPPDELVDTAIRILARLAD
jgi:carbohydrate kinase (thermoresistant glucokinase family)